MSARDTLTAELRAEVLRLEDDLRARVASLPEVQSEWRAEYDAARAAERTAAAWEAWVDERVTLAAVAWVLTTVFVRFCEDNALLKPVWISGPRNREAIEAQQQFLRETARSNADVTDREWLLEAVEHLKSLPATAGLVDETSPMWLVTPSGDAATRLLNFWRERNENGAISRDLSDPDLDTRFLGDLYQDISEDAKKRYALLQTPVFVEEFILDRTLEPALNERPLEGFKMIDPTCGSGHFLLGGFQRLLDRWHKHAPGLDQRERVQAALDSVYGVDINPFAVAIARFRLTVAALQACGLTSLENAPAFKYHLAVGDSLLHGLDQGELDLGTAISVDRPAANFAFATENLDVLRRVLRGGTYDVVIGNPPYITARDRALNELYRRSYKYCKGKYALTVPFMERFFNLAKRGPLPGWVGQITSNSFMKREFGGPLIEKFFPGVDLCLVIDTSGAYIPGHGTPTVIIAGRNQRPSRATVRTVLGNRGEPSPPVDASAGLVWSSIVSHVDAPGWEDDWITVADLDRSRLASHPWSLTGGGAVELLEAIQKASVAQLRDRAQTGQMAITGEDDAFLRETSEPRYRRQVNGLTPYVHGEQVRDWQASYSRFGLAGAPDALADRELWRWRMLIRPSLFFGATREERSLRWTDFIYVQNRLLDAEMVITWAEISTHNHFSLYERGPLFDKSAPVLVLPDGASTEDHLGLLAILNSSTACFWLKQNSHNKGSTVDSAGARQKLQPWEDFYDVTGTTLKDFPLPPSAPIERGAALRTAARELAESMPSIVISIQPPVRMSMDDARGRYESVRGRLIAGQEELDWDVYARYGLVHEVLTYDDADLPRLALGERAFEIVLARKVAAGQAESAWFDRHGSTPIVDVQSHWPAKYQDVVRRRIQLIESDQAIRVLEQPEYKRRWASEGWPRLEQEAIRLWILDRLEADEYWFDRQGRPAPSSVAVLADKVAHDEELVTAISLWEGRRDVPVATSLEKLVATQCVPFLAAYRYKESGLRKRQTWESAWRLQRLEDAGQYDSRPREIGGQGPVPAPSKYTTPDFQRAEYWSNRGKLDTPRERFTSYPGAMGEGDGSLMVGWGGWDEAQQSLALATLIQLGEQQGWSEDRLIPLVAGLSELLPWVEQWHSEPLALYGGSSPAEFFSGLLDNYMVKLGATRESLAAWRPPAPTRRRKAKS